MVRVSSTLSTLFYIYFAKTVYLSLEFECEKNEKRPGLAHFSKKQNIFVTLIKLRGNEDGLPIIPRFV